MHYTYIEREGVDTAMVFLVAIYALLLYGVNMDHNNNISWNLKKKHDKKSTIYL